MPTAVRKLKEDLSALSKALKRLQEDTGFSRWALVTLMRSKTGLPKKTVEAVIDGLEELVDEAFRDDDAEGGS